jgi:hypothetical protein
MVRALLAAALSFTLVAPAWAAPAVTTPPDGADNGPVDAEWAERWREDLAFLAEQLPEKHPDPFVALGEEEFAAEVERLDEGIPRMSHAQIVVALAELIARLEDGHSRVTLPLAGTAGFFSGHSKTPEPKVPGLLFGHLPVRFRIYPDGLYVQRATPEHAALLGGRVGRLGSLSGPEAVAAVGEVAHHDNEWQRRLNTAAYLAIPEVLEAKGVIAEADSIPLLVIAPDGRKIAATLAPAPTDHAPEWVETYDGATTPLYLRDPDTNYWFEHLADERTVFFQYNEVYNRDDAPDAETIEAFALRLADFVAAHDVDRLVIDLRFNRGGSGELNHPLLHALIRSPELREVGSLYAIIGRATFSAAMMFALDLEQHTPVLFVGEPAGSRPNHYGDSRKLELPNSGLTVRLSSLYWQYSKPYDARTTIEPHIPAPLTADAYRAGRDPALEAILGLGAPADLAAASAGESSAAAAGLGSWTGSIFFNPETIDVAIHVEHGETGVTAILDVPAEKAYGIRLEEARVEGETLRMVLTAFGDPIRLSARIHGDRMLARADFGRRPVPFVLRQQNQ